MSTPERRYLSEDESVFRLEYLEDHPMMEDDEEVVLHHVGDTGAVVEVSGQIATKTHASLGGYRREHAALSFVTRHGLVGVPRLLADNDTARRLSLERIFGVSVCATRDEVAPRVWQEAGAWLRLLHALPQEKDDTVSFGAAMALRLRAALEEIAEPLSAGVQDAVTDVLARCDKNVFATPMRVFCHRDFRPRNWMTRRDGRFVAIDFEHARGDFPEVDFARLVPYWRANDTLRVAFLQRYLDARLSVSDERLRVCLVVDALQTLAWGIAHGHPGYQIAGRALADAAARDYSERTNYLQLT